ncbi:MAG: acyl-CoA dehydrogenase family protein [Candidatus Binatia bacterium]|nr:acyl-CoA dehydrogenase family protein [Candidatus Binatia bacterium]
MDLRFTPEQEQFRSEIRRWLADHPPPRLPVELPLAEEVARLREWQRTLAAGGWVGVHWPRAYGGRGASLAEHYILQEELARVRSPELIGRIGVNLVGPTLIAHGTDEQKRRYLPAILTAEEIWCQLFSEPGAGSDLAALRCRAEPAEGGFWVSGEKVWTSYAQFARWGILLARTGGGRKKTEGISFLIVDMQSSGIEVRPLRQMTGSEEFNQVRFDRVWVPRAHLVGEDGAGWSIAQTTLSHERGTSPRQLVIHRILLDEMLSRARAEQRSDPVFRQELAQAWIEMELFKLFNWRVLTRLQRKEKLGAEASVVKLFWSEASQRMHETALRLLGPRALLLADSRALQDGRWTRSYLYYRAATIFAGTSEIQRNIVAQRVLGLPREPA